MSDNPTRIGEEMTLEECMSFLATKGHGVLSMVKDGSAYGIPMSFGYDGDNHRFLFEFLSIHGSKKQQFVTDSTEVSLTVYDFESEERWASVIVTGILYPARASDISERAVSSFLEQADDGAAAVRWAGADTVERDWYELRPTNITGRRRDAQVNDS